MNQEAALKNTYLVVAALLGAHEVDSGYWHEWELFGLPGGPELFVALHVAIFLLLLWGYGLVVANRRPGAVVSLVLAGAGLFALVIHGTFLALGHRQFRDPVSLLVLALLGAASAWLAVLAWRGLGRKPK